MERIIIEPLTPRLKHKQRLAHPNLGMFLALWSGYISAGSSSLPAMPNPPTSEACQEFSHQTHSRLQQILKAKFDCATPPMSIGSAKVCSWSSNRVHIGLREWPHCSDPTADEECALLRQLDKEVRDCFQAAARKADDKEKTQLAIKAYTNVENEFRTMGNRINDMRDAWNNPARFMKEKIGQYVSSRLLAGLYDQRGGLTERGRSLTQETYNFIFSKTLGNRDLYSSNPIIAAIEDTAAEEIRRAHTMAISEMKKMEESMSKISFKPENRSHRPSRAPERRAPSSDDCAILSSPQSADLAIDDPERFEMLVNRCQ